MFTLYYPSPTFFLNAVHTFLQSQNVESKKQFFGFMKIELRHYEFDQLKYYLSGFYQGGVIQNKNKINTCCAGT